MHPENDFRLLFCGVGGGAILGAFLGQWAFLVTAMAIVLVYLLEYDGPSTPGG